MPINRPIGMTKYGPLGLYSSFARAHVTAALFKLCVDCPDYEKSYTRQHQLRLGNICEPHTQTFVPRGLSKISLCASTMEIMTTTCRRLRVTMRREMKSPRTVIDYSAEDSTPNLGQEHNTRGDLEVLSHLQVSRKVDDICDNVVAPHRKLYHM